MLSVPPLLHFDRLFCSTGQQSGRRLAMYCSVLPRNGMRAHDRNGRSARREVGHYLYAAYAALEDGATADVRALSTPWP